LRAVAFNKNKVMATATKYAEKGAYDKAIAEYLKVVKEEPDDVRAWLKLGDCYAKKGSRKEATSTYLKVAEFYGNQGFYLKAVAVYKQILKLDPTVIQVNLRLAELYQQLGLLSDAQSQYEHCAGYFQRSGRVRDALDVMQKLVELDQDNIPSRIKLAELYSKENLKEEAVREFRIAADQLREQGRVDDFVKVAERLLWHKPDDLQLAQELARLYLTRNDPKRALAKLQQCFQTDSRNIETLTLLATAFQSIGQIPKTISVYKEMARLHGEAGNDARRRELLETVLNLSPEDQDARAALYGAGFAPSPLAQQGLHVAADASQHPGPSPLPGSYSLLSNGLSPISSQPLVDSFPDASISVHVDADDFSLPRDEESEEVEEIEDIEEVEDLEHILGESSGRSQEKEIARLLTETDVFVKYGLYDKAIEHLQQVFEMIPEHLEGREKLKDLYLQMGDIERAVLELLYLSDVYAEAGPDTAIYYLQHVLQLVPGHPAAQERLESFGVTVPPEGVIELGAESHPRHDDEAARVTDPHESSLEFEESSSLYASSPRHSREGATEDSTIETASSEEIVSTSGGSQGLEEELEEVEFFLQQGLLDEARNMLLELGQSFPGNALVLEKLGEIDGTQETSSLVDRSFDLSAQISNELDGDANHMLKAEERPVKDVFEQFRQGVADQVDVGDADTHYDLGVAYKEMGLVEDAVAEFELARENPDREALAQTMIGHCYVQTGQHTEAINAYKRGLYAERKTESEELELYYALGTTYLALTDPREALYYFQKVAKREPNFRDVQRRIAEIESSERNRGS
jgi:tetratricopeptide (TPR) repeat protein